MNAPAEESGDLALPLLRKIRLRRMVGLITLVITLAGGVARAGFHAAEIATRLEVVEGRLVELQKDSERLRQIQLVVCRLCAKDPECRGACGDQ